MIRFMSGHGVLRFGINFLLLLELTVMTASATNLQWYWRSPLPQGNPLHNIMFGNGLYLAIGDAGTILTSSDGTNWTHQASGTTAGLNDCAYGAGMYVVVGEFGTVLTSSNAISWTPQYAGTFYSLKGVTFAGGQFVAVGEQTTILTSVDGEMWSQRSSGNWELFDVTYGNGVFVATGGETPFQGTPGTRVILSSSDARTWAYRLLASGPPFGSIAWGSGQFVAVTREAYYGATELWSSADGVDWQPRQVPWLYYSLSTIGFADGKWIVANGDLSGWYSGSGKMFASENLTDWSTVVTNTIPVTGFAFGGKFVAARADGTFLISSNGFMWANPWPEQVVNNYFYDFEFLNDTFLGVGYGCLYSSADGIQWTSTPLATNTGPLLSLTYGNGLFVAGGEYRTIWISVDGVNWTNPAPDLSIQPYAADVVVAYGSGVFVGAAGYAADILTSADGTNWMVQQLQTNSTSSVYFRDIAFGNGRFVAVSESATATSSDGTNWFFNAAYNGLQSVIAGNGLFVAAGYNVIATSVDGTNWTMRSSSAFGSLRDVAFGNGVFVVVSADSFYGSLPSESPIWISTDGMNWSRASSGTSRNLYKSAYGNYTFVIAGENGTILQSDPLVSLVITAQSPPHLQLLGPTNRTYRIEYQEKPSSTGNWAELMTLHTNRPNEFIDYEWTNSATRFYRAVLLP